MLKALAPTPAPSLDDIDVNQDGEINVSDVIIVVNMILGLIDVSLDADMNNDNIIDIIDVVMIIDVILNN